MTDEFDVLLLLILGVDTFLDMGRSATNVLGNAIAASVVAQSEQSLGAELSEEEILALTATPAVAVPELEQA